MLMSFAHVCWRLQVVIGGLQMEVILFNTVSADRPFLLCKLSCKIMYTMSCKVALLQFYGHFVASLILWSCASALPRPSCL